jgi:hypothetical protein
MSKSMECTHARGWLAVAYALNNIETDKLNINDT